LARRCRYSLRRWGCGWFFMTSRPKLQLGNSQPCESLQELLHVADFVTLHVPATPQTQWMIGPEELAAMKKGSYLLNASRGTVVQIDALCHVLRSGHLAGAAVDVYPEEPEENTDSFVTPLASLPNVILTPHIGGSTQEAQASIGREVAQSICKFVAQGATTGAVNFPQVELPPSPGTHRILNVHKNVPGVLRDISRVVSELNANIHSQMLSTDEHIGYLDHGSRSGCLGTGSRRNSRSVNQHPNPNLVTRRCVSGRGAFTRCSVPAHDSARPAFFPTRSSIQLLRARLSQTPSPTGAVTSPPMESSSAHHSERQS
jgi:hypothetical protein